MMSFRKCRNVITNGSVCIITELRRVIIVDDICLRNITINSEKHIVTKSRTAVAESAGIFQMCHKERSTIDIVAILEILRVQICEDCWTLSIIADCWTYSSHKEGLTISVCLCCIILVNSIEHHAPRLIAVVNIYRHYKRYSELTIPYRILPYKEHLFTILELEGSLGGVVIILTDNSLKIVIDTR